MEFKFESSINVDEEILNDMYKLAKDNPNMSVYDAVNHFAVELDDDFYFTFLFIRDQVVEEIYRRLNDDKARIKH